MGNSIQQMKLQRKKAQRDKRIKAKMQAQEALGALNEFAGAASMACIDNPGKITDFYYVETEKIGEGSYGRVCRCSNMSTGAPRAVKILRKVSDKREVRRFRQEIVLLRQLDHPHIAKLFEHFESQRYLYMVMQVCDGGELFDHLVKTGHYTENQTATIMQQLFRAVFYMHAQSIVHRDLKLENLMLLKPGPIEGNTIKVIDFGSARMFEEGQMMQTKIGAPYFIAPQILAGRYNELVDTWTLGVVMYCLMCGYPPFFGESDAEILAKVRVGYFYFNASDWKQVSEAAKNLIRNLLKVNQTDRSTAKQALFDEWITRKASMWRAPFKLRYVDNMRMFGPMHKLKKATLTIMAAQLDEEYTGPLIETFMCLDESGEGTISAEEMKEGLIKSGVPQEEIPEDLDHLAKQVDGNGSGELTISEFVASTLDPRIYTNEEFCWAAFRIFDRNCDGKIGVKELRDTMTNGTFNDMPPREQKLVQEENVALLDEVDEDGDGEVDFAEFMHMMLGTTKKREVNKKQRTHEEKVAGAALLAEAARDRGIDILELMKERGGLTLALAEASARVAAEKAAQLKKEEAEKAAEAEERMKALQAELAAAREAANAAKYHHGEATTSAPASAAMASPRSEATAATAAVATAPMRSAATNATHTNEEQAVTTSVPAAQKKGPTTPTASTNAEAKPNYKKLASSTDKDKKEKPQGSPSAPVQSLKAQTQESKKADTPGADVDGSKSSNLKKAASKGNLHATRTAPTAKATSEAAPKSKTKSTTKNLS